MSNQMTAQPVIDCIKTQCGAAWQDSLADVFNVGNSNSVVTGITTSFTPSIEVTITITARVHWH